MPTRDNNGFRKLLVVLSRAGKLAIDCVWLPLQLKGHPYLA